MFNRVTNSADPNYGRLSFAGTTSAGVPAAPRRLAVAPQSLYISAATAVSVFTLDPVSGLPQHDADHSAGAAWQPGAMVVSPQQALLFVGSADAPYLRLFAIGSGGGAIPPGRLAQAATLQHQDHQGIEDLLLGPERHQVYLAASGAAALSVAVFRRGRWQGIEVRVV